jgi:hypothetical protein
MIVDDSVAIDPCTKTARNGIIEGCSQGVTREREQAVYRITGQSIHHGALIKVF